MKFEQILPALREGKKARRKSWLTSFFIEYKSGFIFDGSGRDVELLTVDLFADDWEFVSEPEIDWQKVIDNKCLCWFWNSDERDKVIRRLSNYTLSIRNYFYDDNDTAYYYCRPVRKDEVTFYEDVEDEI